MSSATLAKVNSTLYYHVHYTESASRLYIILDTMDIEVKIMYNMHIGVHPHCI